jgi:hypothetical protein
LFLSHKRYTNTALEPFLSIFLLAAFPWEMKLVLEIKPEPVTQTTAIIIRVVVSAAGSLAKIAIYVDSPPLTGIFWCAVLMAIIVYLALHLAPC